MPGLEQMGRWLLVVGLVIVAVGGLVMLVGRFTGLGPLPGDVVWRRNSFTLYAPITTMIILSIVLSLLLTIGANLFLRR